MDILALHLQSFIDYGRLRNIRDNGLIREFESSAAPMIGRELFYEILDSIHNTLKDDLLGIRVGRFLNLSALGLIYQISMQASTMEEGIHYLKSFIDATIPIIHMSDKTVGDKHIISLKIDNDQKELNRVILESVLTIISKELMMMSQKSMEIRISSPYHHAGYPEMFYPDETYSIIFPDVALKGAVKNQSDKHLDYLIPQYLKMIEELKRTEDFVNKVKIAALNMATPALPRLEDIADNFNLTPRTFQRTLAKEQTTFRQVADDLKKDISSLLLRNKQYSVTDISYLLGYSEPAAFFHSFNKWYGDPPAIVRGRILKAG